MKTLKRTTLVMTCISILYIAIAYMLAFTELSLRTWADIPGKMTAALLTPLLILILLMVRLHQSRHVHEILKAVFTVAAVGAYGFYAYFAILMIAFSVQEERMIAKNLLVVNESEFLGESKYSYYRPVTLFFRTPAELTDEIKIEYLEKKYDREFVSYNGKIRDKEFPEVKVSVYLQSMKLQDDCVEGMALKYLTDGYESLEIKRDYDVSKVYGSKNGFMQIRFDGEADIEAVSEDISRLIEYVMEETDFFDEQRGNVCYLCYEGEREIKGAVPFGNPGNRDSMPDDYYHDPDRIEEIVREKYEEYANFYRQIDETREQYSGEKLDEEADSSGVEPETDYPEEAAKILYDTVFADEGYSYEVHYSAKGNLYIDLGSRDGYDFSLVYDRISKNGACDLFVLYRSAEGSDYDTIIDMYAVERSTQKAVLSGKKTWSDVGTREYREITGE